jgi:ribosomal protein S18 acetylase RimI-like enzyme
MRIRTFSETDRRAVIELWKACDLTRPWNNPDLDISRKLSIQPELFLVGEVQGEVVASAMGGYDGHRGSVFYLAVSPPCQGRGYGKLLMAKLEELLIALGCPKLNIVVRASNAQALKFYEAEGYSVDDVISLGKRLIPDVCIGEISGT